jgi:hypothetical protein
MTRTIAHYLRAIFFAALAIPCHFPVLAQEGLLTAVAADASSIAYPYNPDEDHSGHVGANDLLPFLIYFGNPLGFYDNGEELDPMSLQNVLSSMATTILEQQASLAALQETLAIQQAALSSLSPLLSLVPVAERSSFLGANNTWELTEMNVQLTNGTETTYGESNGLGNLILGYNESEGGHHDNTGAIVSGEVRSGSHNLVLGAGHTYQSNGAFVGGYNNSALGQGASLFSGQSSYATGGFSAILGGLDNRATGTHSCISGGHSNTASGDRSAVSGGLLNQSAGIATSILGGQYMQVFEQYETASGQYDINN